MLKFCIWYDDFLQPEKLSDYEKNSFDKKDQGRLAECLYKTKANFILIIKDTPIISSLYKNKKGVHCSSPPGSYAFRNFWLGEYDKCKNGHSVNGYRITGHHYFFLNFYKLLNANNVGKAGSGREYSNPNFWAKHYEYFHYIELC